MRERFAAVAILMLTLVSPVARLAGQPPRTQASQTLPPVSYVCPMTDHVDVSDKPGTCRQCGMTLVPVRLDAKWWCPTHQALEVSDGPGKCRRDGKDLVQV